MNALLSATILPGDSGLAGKLTREIQGKVLFDRASRGRYSTDASIYQVEPLGVIVPETIADVQAAADVLLEAGFDKVDYIEVRHAETLEPLPPAVGDAPARVLVAAWLGKTRLIDNMAVLPKTKGK